MLDGEAHGCPVRDGGFEPRPECAGCTGLPIRGMVRLRRREILHREGEGARHLYAVVRGYLRETRLTEDARVVGVRLVGPGALIGAESLSVDRYATTVEALRDAALCRVDLERVKETIAGRPAQALALIRHLSQEAVALRDGALLLGPAPAEARVLSLLEQLCPGREGGQWCELPLTRTEIAEFLGLALATVSRTVHALARRGFFEVHGRRIRWKPPAAPSRLRVAR